MSQVQYSFNKHDEYYTPSYAVYPIIKFLEPNSIIWCPFDEDSSEFVKVFSKEGFIVTNGHINNGKDFFNTETPKCDYIISNPPYSMKREVFKKLFEIQKPFAMLINFQGIFDHKDRFEMFKNNRIEMLWLSPRVNYIKNNNTQASGVPFQSGYLCSKILKKQIEFETLNKTFK